MGEVTFKIANKQYLYLSYYCADGRLESSLNAKVSKEDYNAGNIPKPIQRRMDRLKAAINGYADKAHLANKPIYKSDIEVLILEELKAVKRVSKSSKLHDSFGRYYNMLLGGEILNEDKPYSQSVLTIHKALYTKWTALDRIKGKALNDISVEDFTWLKNEMNKAGLAKNSISSYILYLKTFFKRTYKKKWHTNRVFEDNDINVGKDKIDMFIYLKEDEIKRIAELPVRESAEATRDMLVFGCYTGLRFSDLNRLDPNSLEKGILSVDTKKRSKGVQIPVNSIVRDIWNKYGGKFPYRNQQSFSTSLKRFCKRAGINEMCLYARTIGGQRVNRYVPKWQLVSSHTMRRSFATNAVMSGVPETVVAKIMGIEMNILQRYIKITTQENAELAKKHAFFG